MINHSTNDNKKFVEHLNPGQIHIIHINQPLYALAKQLQWKCPDIYGEDKYIVMLGGLPIE